MLSRWNADAKNPTCSYKKEHSRSSLPAIPIFDDCVVVLLPVVLASATPEMHNEGMELGQVIDALYDSKINCSISSFWDGGLLVRLGDEMNAFRVETACSNASEAAAFLDRAARREYPDSNYAVRRAERECREAAPNNEESIHIVKRKDTANDSRRR